MLGPLPVLISLTLSPFGLRSAGTALLRAGASMAQSAAIAASPADSQLIMSSLWILRFL